MMDTIGIHTSATDPEKDHDYVHYTHTYVAIFYPRVNCSIPCAVVIN